MQEIELLTGTEADDGEEDISMMVLPDYSSGNNEKDIHVKNFNINVGGLELLDCADLKLAYGRKVWCGRQGGARGGCGRVVCFLCVCVFTESCPADLYRCKCLAWCLVYARGTRVLWLGLPAHLATCLALRIPVLPGDGIEVMFSLCLD